MPTITRAPSIETVSVLPNGALRVAGHAVRFWEEDRTRDRFDPAAFATSADRFMNGDPAMYWDHQRQKPLGRVGTVETLDLSPEGDGLYAVATVDYREPGHQMRLIWEGVASRLIHSFSFGGFLTRNPRNADGTFTIKHINITELSVTGRPAGYRTGFAVVGVGEDPVMDALAGAKLAALRASLAAVGVRA